MENQENQTQKTCIAELVKALKTLEDNQISALSDPLTIRILSQMIDQLAAMGIPNAEIPKIVDRIYRLYVEIKTRIEKTDSLLLNNVGYPLYPYRPDNGAGGDIMIFLVKACIGEDDTPGVVPHISHKLKDVIIETFGSVGEEKFVITEDLQCAYVDLPLSAIFDIPVANRA